MTDSYVSVSEVAKAFRVTPQTVRAWIHDGLLPAYKFGDTYRIASADLEGFVARSKVSPS